MIKIYKIRNYKYKVISIGIYRILKIEVENKFGLENQEYLKENHLVEYLITYVHIPQLNLILRENHASKFDKTTENFS